MPQVPDLTPTAQPSGAAPEVNLPVPVEAFGGAVGHALTGFGADIEKVSDQIWARAVEMQGLKNETEAKEADAQYMMKSGLLHADFINKEGLNAGPDALTKHIQDLQDLRTSIRGGISNPVAQRMYDASSLGFMGRNIFNAAGHSGQQMKVAGNKADQSRKDLAIQSIDVDPDSNGGFNSTIGTIKDSNLAIANRLGLDSDTLKDMNQKDISTAVSRRINAWASTNAQKAFVAFDEAVKAGVITDQDQKQLQATLQTKFRDQGSKFYSDQALGDRREGEEENKPAQFYVDKALKAIPDSVKSRDPLFADYVRDRVTRDYNRQSAMETNADNMNTRILGHAAITPDANGMLPTSIEQMKANDPQVAQAWDATSRNFTKQKEILSILDHNAKIGRVAMTPENMQQYHTYRGLGLSGTDDQRAEFLAHNFAAETKLTLTQRNDLMNLQDQLTRKAHIQAEADPRVTRALSFLKPDLVAAGIDPKGSAKAQKDYYAFVGALQDQLEELQKGGTGKLPTVEEIRLKGAQLMQQQIVAEHWYGDTKEPMYKLTVPKKDADTIRADPYWQKNGITPNDSMIARIYRAQQFKEKYGGSTAKPQTQPNTTKPPVSE